MKQADLQKTATFMLDCEARRDSRGRLAIYRLPEGDGGGTFEIGGINDRYDHDKAYELRQLIKDGRYDEAEQVALAYYIENTNAVKGWSSVPAVEAFLRDTAFNRGGGGAAKILQMAIGGVTVDGKVGPITRARIGHWDPVPSFFLNRLHEACMEYEMKVAPPVGARRKFWQGLVNRWAKRLAFARSLL